MATRAPYSDPHVQEHIQRTPQEPWDERACSSCGKAIWWHFTKNGKRCCFDVVDGERTAISHFATCPHARQHTKRRK